MEVSSSERKKVLLGKRLVLACAVVPTNSQRTAAALPQIASLNPLVSLTALPTLAPFVRDASGGAQVDSKQGMVQFLKREKVDVVVACDLAIDDLVCSRLYHR